MTMLIVGVHNEVLPCTHLRLPTASSAICRCGAVYDNGNIVVPVKYRDLCGRCAFDSGMRLSDCMRVSATPGSHAEAHPSVIVPPGVKGGYRPP